MAVHYKYPDTHKTGLGDPVLQHVGGIKYAFCNLQASHRWALMYDEMGFCICRSWIHLPGSRAHICNSCWDHGGLYGVYCIYKYEVPGTVV